MSKLGISCDCTCFSESPDEASSLIESSFNYSMSRAMACVNQGWFFLRLSSDCIRLYAMLMVLWSLVDTTESGSSTTCRAAVTHLCNVKSMAKTDLK